MRRTTETLSTLFEGAPAFVERVSSIGARGWDELFAQAERAALHMPQREQVELLNSHPRIGAAPASVSAVSYREQGYDRDPGTASLQERLDRLNDEYERTFGFRFVVFVNGRSRAEIADVIEQHLTSDRGEELERGVRDVIAIARSRLARMREEART